MNFKTLVLISTIFFGANAYAACPLEEGETTECQFEQADVEQALIGTKVKRVFSYCRKEANNSTDSEGLQCRGPAVYEDSYGFFTDKIFEDRFLASEVDRFLAWRIYFVKQEDGRYRSYIDSTTDGVLNIDTHFENIARHIPVTFDSDLRPQFVVGSVLAGSDPIEIVPDTTFTHTRYYAELSFTNGFIRYEVVNGPQEANTRTENYVLKRN